MTTIIFILELAALAALTICGALLLLDVRDKKKRPEDEPDQTEEWLKTTGTHKLQVHHILPAG